VLNHIRAQTGEVCVAWEGSAPHPPERIKRILARGAESASPLSPAGESLSPAPSAAARNGCTDEAMCRLLLDPSLAISAHVLAQVKPQRYASRQCERERPTPATINTTSAPLSPAALL
jgi:hypothetical protein